MILISIIGVLFYSSTLSAPSIRRKPKRTPKKSLIEQIDGYRVGFTYCQRSFWSTFQCPLTLMMESKLFAQRQAEIKKGNISKSGAPTTPRAPYFLKVCEIILSSIWTFFSRFTHKILSKSVSVSEGQSIPENYSLTNSPSLAENTQLQPHQLSEHQHSSPPEISFCLNPIVSQNDSVLVACEDCDCNLNMPLSDIVPADPEPIAAAPPADEPTKACTHIGPLGFPTLPPQLPIRIQTKKERRSEKLKRSSSEQAKPVDTLPLVSVVSEHNPLLPKNPIVSVNESTTKIDQQLAQSPPDEHHSVITQPAPAENEPSAEQSIQSPLLIASPNLLASEVDIGGFDSVNVEDIKPLFDEVLSLPSFPSDSADGVSLLDDDTFDDSQLGQILDESSQQIDTIGPPPGFFEPGPTLSSDPQLPERPSLLADLNETSEVFMATLDAHTLGPLAPLTSASRTVGCSQSPSFFDFSIAPHGSGNNPFFRGDIDWTQPYLDALNNSDTTYQEDEYSEKDFQPLPASLHAPCVDESQWTREDYNGSSYSSSAAGYLSTNYHDSAIAPSFPSYHTMANNLPASRRPTHSYSPHESQVSYQPSYPRTFMPSSRMISEHPRHPNWQYYAQHPSPTLSKSIQQNSPTRQTIKLTLTVKVRLLPPPKVAQVKVIYDHDIFNYFEDCFPNIWTMVSEGSTTNEAISLYFWALGYFYGNSK